MVWFDFRLLEETLQHSDCFKLYFELESTLLIQAHYFLFVCGEYIDWLLIYFSTIKKRVVWKVILSQGPFTRLFFLSFQLHLGEHLNISLKRGFWDCAVISCRKSARQSWKLRRKSNKMTLNLFLWVCIWCVYIYIFSFIKSDGGYTQLAKSNMSRKDKPQSLNCLELTELSWLCLLVFYWSRKSLGFSPGKWKFGDFSTNTTTVCCQLALFQQFDCQSAFSQDFTHRAKVKLKVKI